MSFMIVSEMKNNWYLYVLDPSLICLSGMTAAHVSYGHTLVYYRHGGI